MKLWPFFGVVFPFSRYILCKWMYARTEWIQTSFCLFSILVSFKSANHGSWWRMGMGEWKAQRWTAPADIFNFISFQYLQYCFMAIFKISCLFNICNIEMWQYFQFYIRSIFAILKCGNISNFISFQYWQYGNISNLISIQYLQYCNIAIFPISYHVAQVQHDMVCSLQQVWSSTWFPAMPRRAQGWSWGWREWPP